MTTETPIDIALAERFHMTNDQAALASRHYQDGGMEMYCALLDKAKEFRDALVELPHTNEQGQPVFNGANNWMTYLGKTYYDAAMQLRMYIDRDTVDLETEKRSFRLSGFYSRPAEGQWSHVLGRAFLPGEAPPQT